MALLRVGLVQVRAEVRAEVIAGGGGGRWGHQGRVRALRRGPSAAAAAAAAGVVRRGVRQQQHPEAVLVVQGHALQEVAQQLRGLGRVDPGAAGHERVHVVHTLDVARREPLAGLPAHGVRLCGDTSHRTHHLAQRLETQPNGQRSRFSALIG